MALLTCRCSVDDDCPQGRTGAMSRCRIPVDVTPGSLRSSPITENDRLEQSLESISDDLQATVTELEDLQLDMKKIREILNYSPKSQVEKIREVIDGN